MVEGLLKIPLDLKRLTLVSDAGTIVQGIFRENLVYSYPGLKHSCLNFKPDTRYADVIIKSIPENMEKLSSRRL